MPPSYRLTQSGGRRVLQSGDGLRILQGSASLATSPLRWATLRDAVKWYWRTWPGREPATLRKRVSLGVYESYVLSDPEGVTLDVANFGKATNAEAAESDAGYLRVDRRILIPSEVLPAGVVPAPGDIVFRTTDDTLWFVVTVDDRKFSTSYACTCGNVALANNLRATGTLERAAAAKDTAGRSALSTYTTVGTTNCRLQPEDAEAGDAFDRRTFAKRYTAYLEVPLAVQAHDRFTVGGVSYTVLSFKNPESLLEMMSLDLEAIP